MRGEADNTSWDSIKTCVCPYVPYLFRISRIALLNHRHQHVSQAKEAREVTACGQQSFPASNTNLSNQNSEGPRDQVDRGDATRRQYLYVSHSTSPSFLGLPQARVNFRWRLSDNPENPSEKMMQLKLVDLTNPTETPSEAHMMLYGPWAEKCADIKSNVSTEKPHSVFRFLTPVFFS